MPDSMLFGGYRGGYNVMPEGWMKAATQVGANYAQGIQGLTSGIVGGVNKLMDENASQSQNQQSLPTNMSQYEQVAQATGQQMDPTIIERFANRNDLSGAGLMQLNKDIAGAQQNAIALANMQRQQQQYNMQMEAARRAANQQSEGNTVDNLLSSRNAPPAVQSYNTPPPAVSSQPPPPSYYFNNTPVPASLMNPARTIQNINMGFGNP
jgi:hypothetical protein